MKYSAIAMEASKAKVRDLRKNFYKSCNSTDSNGAEEEEEKEDFDCTNQL